MARKGWYLIMAISKLHIYSYFNRQRFAQAGSTDCANWYGVSITDGKQGQALYPAMGRRHIESLNQNRLVFDAPPRFIFRSIDFTYIIIGTKVFKVDKNFNRNEITSFGLALKPDADVWFAYLTVQTNVYCMFTDGESTKNGSGSRY